MKFIKIKIIHNFSLQTNKILLLNSNNSQMINMTFDWTTNCQWIFQRYFYTKTSVGNRQPKEVLRSDVFWLFLWLSCALGLVRARSGICKSMKGDFIMEGCFLSGIRLKWLSCSWWWAWMCMWTWWLWLGLLRGTWCWRMWKDTGRLRSLSLDNDFLSMTMI